jgi:hypothetical protein
VIGGDVHIFRVARPEALRRRATHPSGPLLPGFEPGPIFRTEGTEIRLTYQAMLAIRLGA